MVEVGRRPWAMESKGFYLVGVDVNVNEVAQPSWWEMAEGQRKTLVTLCNKSSVVYKPLVNDELIIN